MENSQRIGSEVLLYTEGPTPMDFILSFPCADRLGSGIDSYVTRSLFTVRLGRGTLMVFKDVDDQFFCHEACICATKFHFISSVILCRKFRDRF